MKAISIECTQCDDSSIVFDSDNRSHTVYGHCENCGAHYQFVTDRSFVEKRFLGIGPKCVPTRGMEVSVERAELAELREDASLLKFILSNNRLLIMHLLSPWEKAVHTLEEVREMAIKEGWEG